MVENTNTHKDQTMLDLSVLGHTTWEYRSTEKLSYKYELATEKKNKKDEKTYTAIKNEKGKEISIQWHDDEQGQHLTFWDNNTQVAKFTLTNNKEVIWLPSDSLLVDRDIIAKPCNPNNIPIVANKLLLMFKTWVNSQPFARYLDHLSRELVYPPKLVKMLLLFNAYLNVRTKTAERLGKLTDDIDLIVDLRQVDKMFKILLNQVVRDTPHMVRLYSDVETYLLPPASTESVELVVDIPPVEILEPIEVTLEPTTLIVEVAEILPNPEDVDLTDIMEAVKNIK